MGVLVVIADAEGAEGLLRWGKRLAERDKLPLGILCAERGLPTRAPERVDPEGASGERRLVRAVLGAMAAVGLEGVEVNALCNANPPRAVLSFAESTKPTTIVAADDGSTSTASLALHLGERLIKLAPCAVLLLDLGSTDGEKVERIVVAAGDAYGRVALREAAKLLDEGGVLVPLVVAPPYNSNADEQARAEVELAIREAGLEPSETIQPAAVVASQSTQAIARTARGADLLLLGGTSSRSIGRLRATSGWGRGGSRDTAIGVLRPRRKRGKGALAARLERLLAWTPALQTTDRIDLFDRLLAGASLSADFLVLMGFAAAIATLGLLQDSTAVVIGAMVVAPLMTPLIGAGLSLVQGNGRLFRRALTTMATGVGVALGVSVLITAVVPVDTLTLEVLRRGEPTLLDLAVALISGAAAAYAMARPNVGGALAGVAIAAALVPPLASSGIALSTGDFGVSAGAFILLLTNLVAIVIGAAIVFWALGVQGLALGSGMSRWVRQALLALGLLAALLIAPLWLATANLGRAGQMRPMAFPLAERVLARVVHRVEEEKALDPRVTLVLAGRPGVSGGDYDVILILMTSRPARATFLEDLRAIVRREMNPDARTRIEVLQAGAIQEEGG